jgi:hypothetical protein
VSLRGQSRGTLLFRGRRRWRGGGRRLLGRAGMAMIRRRARASASPRPRARAGGHLNPRLRRILVSCPYFPLHRAQRAADPASAAEETARDTLEGESHEWPRRRNLTTGMSPSEVTAGLVTVSASGLTAGIPQAFEARACPRRNGLRPALPRPPAAACGRTRPRRQGSEGVDAGSRGL